MKKWAAPLVGIPSPSSPSPSSLAPSPSPLFFCCLYHLLLPFSPPTIPSSADSETELKTSKMWFILEPNMSDRGLGTWIQIVPNDTLQHGNDLWSFLCQSKVLTQGVSQREPRADKSSQSGECSAVDFRDYLMTFLAFGLMETHGLLS